MYHLSILPPKQYTIPLIVSRQISIANMSPNFTDARAESCAPVDTSFWGLVVRRLRVYNVCSSLVLYLHGEAEGQMIKINSQAPIRNGHLLRLDRYVCRRSDPFRSSTPGLE